MFAGLRAPLRARSKTRLAATPARGQSGSTSIAPKPASRIAATAARAFRVYYRKVNPPGASDYLMDHTSFIYLVGPDGRVRQLFRPNTPPETIAAAIKGQLRQL